MTAATSAVASGSPAQREQLLDRAGPRPPLELGREVRDRRLVGLDGVEAGHDDGDFAIGASDLVARRGVPPLPPRAAELVVEGSGRERPVGAASMSACSAASTSAGRTSPRARPGRVRRPAPRPRSVSGSSSNPPSMTRTRSRRSSGSSLPGAFSRAATTARHAGSEDAGRGYGAGSIGIPYRRCRPGAPSASFSASPGSSVSTIIRVARRADRRSASAGAGAPARPRTRTDTLGR